MSGGAVEHAERACLGALLLDPVQITELRRWLSPVHFHHPWHQATFDVLLRLPAQRSPADAVAPASAHVATPVRGTPTGAGVEGTVRTVAQHLHDRGDVRFNRPADAALFLTDLLAAPGKPARAPVYARMVLEGCVHRAVASHATRLGQLAGADLDPRARLDAAQAVIDQATDAIEELTTRWATATGHRGNEPSAIVEPLPRVTRTGPDTRRLEDATLGAILRSPADLPRLRALLRPSDFVAPGRRELYVLLCDLDTNRQPVEPLTLMWAAHTHGVLDPATLTAERVLALPEQAPPGDPLVAARELVGVAVRRRTLAAAQALDTAARRPDLDPPALLDEATRQVEDTRRQLARLHRAAVPIRAVPTGRTA